MSSEEEILEKVRELLPQLLEDAHAEEGDPVDVVRPRRGLDGPEEMRITITPRYWR